MESCQQGMSFQNIPAMGVVTLTEIDRKVLSWMAEIYASGQGVNGCGYVTPADIGAAMGGTLTMKAQGLGRMGGRRAKRLREMGLVEDCSAMRGGFPAYRITALGRQVLAKGR